jgi:hypothetical protein
MNIIKKLLQNHIDKYYSLYSNEDLCIKANPDYEMALLIEADYLDKILLFIQNEKKFYLDDDKILKFKDELFIKISNRIYPKKKFYLTKDFKCKEEFLMFLDIFEKYAKTLSNDVKIDYFYSQNNIPYIFNKNINYTKDIDHFLNKTNNTNSNLKNNLYKIASFYEKLTNESNNFYINYNKDLSKKVNSLSVMGLNQKIKELKLNVIEFPENKKICDYEYIKIKNIVDKLIASIEIKIDKSLENKFNDLINVTLNNIKDKYIFIENNEYSFSNIIKNISLLYEKIFNTNNQKTIDKMMIKESLNMIDSYSHDIINEIDEFNKLLININDNFNVKKLVLSNYLIYDKANTKNGVLSEIITADNMTSIGILSGAYELRRFLYDLNRTTTYKYEDFISNPVSVFTKYIDEKRLLLEENNNKIKNGSDSEKIANISYSIKKNIEDYNACLLRAKTSFAVICSLTLDSNNIKLNQGLFSLIDLKYSKLEYNISLSQLEYLLLTNSFSFKQISDIKILNNKIDEYIKEKGKEEIEGDDNSNQNYSKKEQKNLEKKIKNKNNNIIEIDENEHKFQILFKNICNTLKDYQTEIKIIEEKEEIDEPLFKFEELIYAARYLFEQYLYINKVYNLDKDMDEFMKKPIKKITGNQLFDDNEVIKKFANNHDLYQERKDFVVNNLNRKFEKLMKNDADFKNKDMNEAMKECMMRREGFFSQASKQFIDFKNQLDSFMNKNNKDEYGDFKKLRDAGLAYLKNKMPDKDIEDFTMKNLIEKPDFLNEVNSASRLKVKYIICMLDVCKELANEYKVEANKEFFSEKEINPDKRVEKLNLKDDLKDEIGVTKTRENVKILEKDEYAPIINHKK